MRVTARTLNRVTPGPRRSPRRSRGRDAGRRRALRASPSSWTESWTPAAPARPAAAQTNKQTGRGLKTPARAERALRAGPLTAGTEAARVGGQAAPRPGSAARQGHRAAGGQPGRPQLEGDVRPRGPRSIEVSEAEAVTSVRFANPRSPLGLRTSWGGRGGSGRGFCAEGGAPPLHTAGPPVRSR